MPGRGAIIKGVRLLKKKTRAAVARDAGVSEDLIYRLEKDDPRVELATVVSVARLLGVAVDLETGTATPPKDFDVATVRRVAAQRGRGRPTTRTSPLPELLSLSPDDLKDLKTQAEKRGWSIDEMIAKVFDLGMTNWRARGFKVEDETVGGNVTRRSIASSGTGKARRQPEDRAPGAARQVG